MPVGVPERPPPRDAAFASTLAHGLAILGSFSAATPLLTNKALTQATGLSKGTISRLTHTLSTRGLLVSDASSRGYRLGAGVLTLAYPLLASLWARQVARPLMQVLAQQTGGSVSLGLQHAGHMIYIETVRSHDLSAAAALAPFRPDIGARLPLADSAMGRAWYAQATPVERQQALRQRHEAGLPTLPTLDDTATLIPVPPALANAITSYAAQGYCVSHGAWRPDVHAVAAPLQTPVEGCTLVLNCGMPTPRLQQRSIEALAGEPLRQAAHALDALLAQRMASATDLVSGVMPTPALGTLDDSMPLVTTLAAGLDVLAAFQPGESLLGNKDFAQRTGLAPSTVARLTHTLLQLGYLRRLPGERQYRPGVALLTTAYPLLASLQVRQQARPLLQQLAQSIDGAVSLVIQDRCRMVHIETSRTTPRLSTHPDIGSTLPLLRTAAGKAWLCQVPLPLQTQTLNRLRVLFPDDYATYAPQLTQARREFSQTGCCSNRAQWRMNVYGFATTLARPVEGHWVVLNCGVPAGGATFTQRRQEIVPRLQALARQLDALLENAV